MEDARTTSLEWVDLTVDQPIWERFFSVAPLVVVGTADDEHGHDLAIKHMAMPMGWTNLFGFICTPRHRTYSNVRSHEAFTVSYPELGGVVAASLTTAPRTEDGDKPSLAAVPVAPALHVPGVVVPDAAIQLECRLERIVDGFEESSLIVGAVVAARARPERVRDVEVDEQDLLEQAPPLVYVHPGRLAEAGRTVAFPYHKGWRR